MNIDNIYVAVSSPRVEPGLRLCNLTKFNVIFEGGPAFRGTLKIKLRYTLEGKDEYVFKWEVVGSDTISDHEEIREFMSSMKMITNSCFIDTINEVYYNSKNERIECIPKERLITTFENRLSQHINIRY